MQEIVDELKRINTTLSGMLESMTRSQKSRIMQVFEVAGAVVGVLGIISIADIIRRWVIGG